MKATDSARAELGQPRYVEINMSHIEVGGGGVGLIFAVGTVIIFFVGVPAGALVFAWCCSYGLDRFAWFMALSQVQANPMARRDSPRKAS